MTKFEVLEKTDGWHVRLISGLLDEVFENKNQAIAFNQTFISDGASCARSEIEQGDTPLPMIFGDVSGVA